MYNVKILIFNLVIIFFKNCFCMESNDHIKLKLKIEAANEEILSLKKINEKLEYELENIKEEINFKSLEIESLISKSNLLNKIDPTIESVLEIEKNNISNKINNIENEINNLQNQRETIYDKYINNKNIIEFYEDKILETKNELLKYE